LAIWPDLSAAAGNRYKARKLEVVSQILAVTRDADLSGAVIRCRRRGGKDLLDRMFDLLFSKGILDKIKGSQCSKQVTRYRLTPDGRDLLRKFNTWDTVLEDRIEPNVVVRTGEGKARVEVSPGGKAAKVLGQTLSRSALNNRGRWQVRRGDRQITLMVSLRAIFKEKFGERGGRMYQQGPDGYQQLTKAERKLMTVDGQPSVELDFSGFHARALYHQQHLDCPEDVYQPDVILHELWRPGFGRLQKIGRKLVKRTLNTVLNAGDRLSATRSVQKAVNTNGDYRRILHDIIGLDVPTFIRRVESLHKPIAGFFYTGEGMRLQSRLDGPLICAVLELCMANQIPALPLHDAVITAVKHADEVERFMAESYFSYYGFLPVITRSK
jgi:hypothetical protein